MLLCSLISLYSLFAFGQKNLKPGHIVLNNGDTLQGQINYRNWESNPIAIDFLQQNGQTTVYRLPDLSSFTVDKTDRYEKAVIKRSTRPVDLYELDKPFIDTVLTDTVFLRTIVLGEVSLYELVKGKTYYFLKNADGSYEELMYRVELLDAIGNHRNYLIYRDQLKAKFALQGSLANKVQHLEYKPRSMGDFINHVNKQSTGAGNNWKTEKTKLVRFFAGTGLQYSRLKITGPKHDLTRMNFDDPSISPVFQAGVDVFTSRNMQRFFLRAELGYSSLSYKGEYSDKLYTNMTKTKSYELSMRNINASISLLYNLVRSKPFDLYTGLGYTMHFTKWKH